MVDSPWYHKYTMTEIGQAIASALAGSINHQATRTLTAAEFQIVPATNFVELVPFVPAGMAPVFIRGAIVRTGAVFGNGSTPLDGSDTYFCYGNDSDLASGPFIDAGQRGTDWVSHAATPHTVLLPAAESTSINLDAGNIQLAIYNTPGNFTGGSPVILTVEFRILDQSTGALLTLSESGWNETTRTFTP